MYSSLMLGARQKGTYIKKALADKMVAKIMLVSPRQKLPVMLFIGGSPRSVTASEVWLPLNTCSQR